MKSNILTLRRSGRPTALAMLCVIAIGPGDALAGVWGPTQASVQVPVPASHALASAQAVAPALSADRLDSVVAPIALYPDPLLAQTLAAATYPGELEELNEFLGNNPGLQGAALASAVATQPWDPSVQSMAAFPDVVMLMADNIDWTTELGDAFIAQESSVMDAVQRMRQRAERTGNLRSTDQQVVKKTVVENHPVIVIEPANPQVVFVPYYDPAVVFGPAVYPFPVFVSPRRAGLGLAFGTGIGMGAFWGVGGGWGWHPGWGRRSRMTINHNNFFVRNSAFYRNRSTWMHNGGRRGTVGTSGRAVSRRNRGHNPNRVAGTTGRSDANRRGNVGSRRGTSGNRNVTRSRPTGTSRRAESGRNRGRSVNRPTGTSGRSVNRANRGGGSGDRTRGNRGGNMNRGNRGGGGGGGRRGGQRPG